MQNELEITSSGLALLEPLLEELREHLENERHRVNEEIRHYPAPIPACDAQFNYLLEERVGITQELARLKALARESLSQQARIKYIDEFVASSRYITGEVEQRIRSSLVRLSGPALTVNKGSV